jgi:hypothetical protein
MEMFSSVIYVSCSCENFGTQRCIVHVKVGTEIKMLRQSRSQVTNFGARRRIVRVKVRSENNLCAPFVRKFRCAESHCLRKSRAKSERKSKFYAKVGREWEISMRRGASPAQKSDRKTICVPRLCENFGVQSRIVCVKVAQSRNGNQNFTSKSDTSEKFRCAEAHRLRKSCTKSDRKTICA